MNRRIHLLHRVRMTAAAITLVAAQQASASWQTLGQAEPARSPQNTVELATTSGARLRVSMPSPDVVRIRVSPTGTFERDFSYAIADQPRPLPLVVANDPGAGTLSIRTQAAGSMHVVVHLEPSVLVEVRDQDDRLVVADDPDRPMAFDPATGAIEASKSRVPTELYYGFGEKALPISRHEQYMTMWNSDTPGYPQGLDPIYQSIPFFIALHDGRSYGIFLDNTWRTYFDMGKTDYARYRFGADGGELDYYVFTGGKSRSAANIVRAYTALTGRGPLPPLWALGYQQSRYSYSPQSQVRDVARTFRDKRMPADVIYLDIGYMDGYRIFTWSPKDFPEPEKLLHELDAQGFHAVTIVDPGIKVDDGYAIYRDGRSQGAFMRTANGDELHASVWPGPCAFPDFTSPGARAWFGTLYAKFLDQGVSGFWNDMNEPGVFLAPDSGQPELVHDPRKTFPLDARHAGDGDADTHARYHNVYGMQMARATFEGLRRLRPDHRPFVLTRAGYAGVQRYSAVWTGDNDATWEHLAMTIPMLTNLSVSGVSFVGADVGGFVRTPSGELYARWLQAAVLTPFLRTHSAIDTEPREPWSFGADFERINRATIELRYRFLPYIYTLFANQELRGDPVMRPLWFSYPSDVKTYLVEDEFLVGGDLLVAPIVREHETRRQIYFPAGDTWIDWWNGARHAGGSEQKIDVPLDRLPLFVRAGAIIPVQPVVQSTRDMPGAPLTLVVAPGAQGTSTVYQDSGDGYGYRRGESRTITATQGAEGVTLVIPRTRGYQPVAAIEVLGAESTTATRLDGKRADAVTFDAATHRLRITLPNEDVRRIQFAPVQ
jgi:alpha-glucosidase